MARLYKRRNGKTKTPPQILVVDDEPTLIELVGDVVGGRFLRHLSAPTDRRGQEDHRQTRSNCSSRT
jgi:hypothetical protein